MATSSFLNRLKTNISNSPGTSGGFVISAPVSGFVSFTASDNGKVVDILITEGSEWELRKDCVYTHSTLTLSRGTLVSHSSVFDFTSAAQVSVVLLGERVLSFVQSGAFVGQGQALVYDAFEGAWTNSNNFVPDQAGNEFLFLTTDGLITSWAAIPTLPDQTGNSGKYLSTNGTSASWSTAPSPTGYKYSGAITTAPTGTGDDTLVIGDGASASTTTNAVVIGTSASTTAATPSGVSIGHEARCAASTTSKGVAIGQYAYAGGSAAGGHCISIGAGRTGSTSYGALNSRSIAIGTDAIASGTDTVAMGMYSTASGTSSIAIGSSSSFNGGAQATGLNSISIGASSSAASTGSIVIGQGAKVSTGTRQLVIDSSGNGLTHTGARQVIVVSDSPAYTNLGTVAIGYYPGTVAADNANLIGGGYNVISSGATYSSCIAAQQAQTFMVGEQAYACGQFASAGDAQISLVVGRIQSSNATPIELGLYSSTDKIKLANDSTYLFDCDIVARNTATDTESKVWNLKFGIRRGTSAANTSLIGTPTKTIFGEDTGTAGWDINVTADTTNGRPNISVTGEAAKTIRWVASTRITKVTG